MSTTKYNGVVDLTPVTTDIANLQSDLTDLQNIVDTIPNQGANNNNDKRKLKHNSGTLEKIFERDLDGYVTINAYYDNAGAGTAQVIVYEGAEQPSNIIGQWILSPGESANILTYPTYVSDTIRIYVSTDGTNYVYVNLFTSVVIPPAEYGIRAIHANELSIGASTTVRHNEFRNSVEYKTFLGTVHIKTILKFDLSTIPVNTIASQASLNLYVSSKAQIMEQVRITGVLQNYVPTECSYDNYAVGSAWSTPGAEDRGVDIENTDTLIFHINSVVENEWNQFDITAMVNRWLDGSLTNNGLIIWHELVPTGSVTREINFWGVDRTVSERPLLNIIY